MTRTRLTAFVAALGVALCCATPAAAERHVLVLRDDGAIVREANDALLADLIGNGLDEASVSQFDLGQIDKASALVADWHAREAATVVVALGLRAIRPALQLSAGRLAIVAVVSRSAVEDGNFPVDQLSAIVLDQPPDRIFNLIQLALPSVRQVGVLAGAVTRRSLGQCERQARDRHLGLVAEPVARAEELVAATEHLALKADLLLAIPDPVVHNRYTILPLLLTTYRVHVPVLAYSESYLQAGAAMALYSTPAQIARQTAEVALQALDGKRPPALLAPKYFTVGVNATVARAMGLSLPPGEELQRRLETLERQPGQ